MTSYLVTASSTDEASGHTDSTVSQAEGCFFCEGKVPEMQILTPPCCSCVLVCLSVCLSVSLSVCL